MTGYFDFLKNLVIVENLSIKFESLLANENFSELISLSKFFLEKNKMFSLFNFLEKQVKKMFFFLGSADSRVAPRTGARVVFVAANAVELLPRGPGCMKSTVEISGEDGRAAAPLRPEAGREDGR